MNLNPNRFDAFLSEKFPLVDEEDQRNAIKYHFLQVNLRDGSTLQNAVESLLVQEVLRVQLN